MIVVTGATGNIGKKIAERLLSQGQKVRVVARHVDRLKELTNKGAEAFVGSLEDVPAMTKAFTGADAVFTMIPPNMTAQDFRKYQNNVSQALAEAIQKSGVKYVVNLSSLGAHRPDKLGPINGLYDHEQRLNQLNGVNVLHLRPTYFMENLLMNVGLIKNMGINGSPFRADVSFPMIATQDIAAQAAERLAKRDFKGSSVKELLGQRDLSMAEATKVFGQAINKPDLKYVQFPYDEAEKAMTGTGLSPDVARLFIEMSRGFNEGVAQPTQGRNPQTTTPTSIEEFAKTFAEIYKSSKN
jgi:uncharacterized protein YbjT (DUF2867 family)